jgi:hypothetical protein
MTTRPTLTTPDDTASLAAFFKAEVVGQDLDDGLRACVAVLVKANPLAWARATGQAPEGSDAATWTTWLAERGTPVEINARHAPDDMEPRR